MAPARLLERNVRARKPVRADEEGVSEDEYEALAGDAADESEDDHDEAVSSDMESRIGNEDAEVSGEGGEKEEDGNGDVEQQNGSVSFGALKQAWDVLPRKRKRGSDENPEQDDKLDALRKRLRQIKEEKEKAASALNGRRTGGTAASIRGQTRGGADDDEENASSDSDSAPSEEDLPSKSRTSKHAPAEQTSRHQVTRKRTVIALPRTTVRDPRFDALHATPSHLRNNTDKAYAFLATYQQSEIAKLKTALKRAKTDDDKITLRRKINSIENKLKAKAAKEREQEVVSRHRKEERERVKEGKAPFYLKRKEVKERALVEKFKGMKGREREKVVEKRRVKEGQREKRRMPRERRAVV